MSNKLTSKQTAFCEEYLKDLNATQAAIRAGYSKKTAKAIGQENLTKPVIQQIIEKLMAERSERTQIKADDVLRELARIGFSDMRRYVKFGSAGVTIRDMDKLTDDEGACIAEVSETTTKDGGTRRFKLHDKVRALELIGKHLAMFTDKHQVDGNLGVALKIVKHYDGERPDDDNSADETHEDGL